MISIDKITPHCNIKDFMKASDREYIRGIIAIIFIGVFILGIGCTYTYFQHVTHEAQAEKEFEREKELIILKKN